MPPKEHIAPFLPALHASRLRSGPLTADAIRSLAERLGMPLADVYGAISFYHYPPIGEQAPLTKAVCRGPACSLAEPWPLGEDVRYIPCPGRCDRPAPWYDGERFFTPSQTGPDDGAGLPMETGQEEALFRHVRRPDQRRLAQYRASGGYETLLSAVRQGQPDHTIAAVEESGLLGRGGAAFPTAAKWRAAGFEALVPHEWVEVSPEDAADLRLADGEVVVVVSRRGRVRVPVKVTDRSPTGVVFMSFHFPESTPTNLLTTDVYDPITETPEFKACAVRIEKLQ